MDLDFGWVTNLTCPDLTIEARCDAAASARSTLLAGTVDHFLGVPKKTRALCAADEQTTRCGLSTEYSQSRHGGRLQPAVSARMHASELVCVGINGAPIRNADTATLVLTMPQENGEWYRV